MKVYQDITKLPKFKNSVLTIGSFDGVHMGHRKIIERGKILASEVDGDLVIVTFHPHPRSIIYPKDDTLRLLSTLEEKIQLFESIGVKHLVVVPFTIEFSQIDPREYVEKFLIGSFNPKYIIIGYDHKFGLNRQGDIHLLKEYEMKGDFQIMEVKKQELDEITISSTKIRNSLLAGDIREAAAYLGAYYSMQGKVVKGDSIGEKIGFPTANIEIGVKNKMIPNAGIYAVYVTINEEIYQGMLYIGERPTIGEKLKQTIEVNIFDFSGSLYNESIKVSLVDFIRYDVKFENLELLKNQLYLDKNDARVILEKEKLKDFGRPLVQIAILNYNGEEYLESYLSSTLDSSEQDIEVVLIDNGSTDESIDYVTEWHPEVKIVPLSKNYGYAEGYNRGLELLNAKYIALLNSDVLVDSAWLDPIIAYMSEHKDVVAMQPKILSLEHKDKFEYAGASGGYMDLLSYPFCRGRIFDTVEDDSGQYNDIREVFWTSGAAMVVRTDIFKALGGFDGDYFAHQEEIDFCWRAKRAGYKCMVHGGARVYHLGGGTLDYESPKKTFLNFRNNLATIIKNESKRYALFVIVIRLLLDGVAGLKHLIDGRWRNTFAIVEAHLSVYAGIFNIVEKRIKNRALISKVKIGKMNWKGRVRTSIVVDYYLWGIKKFNQIPKNRF